jgi:hypothetical protein
VATAYKARVIALKTFCSYVREVEAIITPAQDATLALKVPPPRPGKKLKERAYDLKLVERFYRATDNQAARDENSRGRRASCRSPPRRSRRARAGARRPCPIPQ